MGKMKFNYHTHTYRSGHSEYVSDEEMLMAAKAEGITTLGFTEHIPNPDLVLPEENNKMLYSETEEYIDSIRNLGVSHPEMKVLVGFEAEYDPMKDGYLGEMREKTDYMILGQHFVPKDLGIVKEITPEYPLIYADMVCKGIDTGIFDIVAHPDYFMGYRDKMKTPEETKEFFKNALIASEMICTRARDMGIPVEINLGGTDFALPNGLIKYPHSLFWQEATRCDGLKVLIGVDAHTLKHFKKVNAMPKKALEIINMVGDKVIYDGYDPVLARQNNQRLQEAYLKNQEKAQSYETNLIQYVIDKTEENIDPDIDPDQSILLVDKSIDVLLEKSNNAATNKVEALKAEITKISEDTDMPSLRRIGKLEKKRKTITEVNMVLANQERLLSKLKGIGLRRAHKGIVIQSKKRFPDLLKLNLHRDDSNKYSGNVSIILISIITMIAGFLIITILYNLYK